MIRKLKLSDINKCIQICEKNFKIEGYSYNVEKDLKFQFQENNINLEFYIFEENNIIKGLAGLSNCWFDNQAFGLFTCYIDPIYQNKGIGKKLTEFRINRIKEIGGRVIFSSTKKPWHLERFGFKQIKSPYDDWKIMQLIIED